MDKLTKLELEEYWKLYYSSSAGNDNDALVCFEIDNEYTSRYGMIQFLNWVNSRL